jgi:hypothetical protein
MSRERDIRNAIVTALEDTNAFNGVFVWGLPEDYGTGASLEAFAAVVPMSSAEENRWDAAATGGIVITARIQLVLAYRHIDPQLRDEGAELLLNTAANAINAQSLAGLTFTQTSRITGWTWQPPTVPERRIVAIYSCQYIVEGWDSYDTTA